MKKLTLIFAVALLPLLMNAQTSERKVIKANRAETQKFLISTNLYDWIDYGTINLAMGYSLARHFSLEAGLKFNDWQFNREGNDISVVADKQKTASVGVRYWPWYVYSGWWISAKGQYSDTVQTGTVETCMGYFFKKAVGAGLSTGYTFMITRRFNIEAGIGFWAGKYLDNTMYPNPRQTYLSYQGPDKFQEVNDISLSLQYLF